MSNNSDNTTPRHDGDSPFPDHQEVVPYIEPIEAPGVQATVVDAIERAPDAPAPIVVMRARSHAWWAIAAVMITFIAAGTFLVYELMPSPRKAQDAITSGVGTVYEDMKAAGAALKPKVEMKTVIDSAVGQLNSKGKLVVLTRTLPVSVEKRSIKKVLWDQFKLEDSAVRLKVNNNSVQYVVPLDSLTPKQFSYDEANHKLVVTLPEPRLDRDMVVVSSNPADWEVDTTISWTRIEDWWGEALENEARKEIRSLVVAAGQEKLIIEEAREAAFLQLNQLIQNLLTPLAPGIEVELRFDPKLAPPPGVESWQPNSAPLS